MLHERNSLKGWEDLLKRFDFLFRTEYRLLKEGCILDSEFFEPFFDLLLEAIEMMSKEDD